MRIAILKKHTTNNIHIIKNKTNTKLTLTFITTIFLLSLSIILIFNKAQRKFSGENALEYVAYQVSLGPRTISSEAHRNVRTWIINQLASAGWETEVQEYSWNSNGFYNIIGKQGNSEQWIVIGAHYDSRLIADRDPNAIHRTQPVPGANDGASGVAVLLELAQCLPKNLSKTIWLVFFDAEDNGNIAGYDWILGSRAFVNKLQSKPDQAIIVDMVGDRDLTLYMEQNSDKKLAETIWHVAEKMGFKEFIPYPKYRILDDHVPFLEAGVPAVDIIDFDYPYWHTSQDTLDKISARSLFIVGETLRVWPIGENQR